MEEEVLAVELKSFESGALHAVFNFDAAEVGLAAPGGCPYIGVLAERVVLLPRSRISLMSFPDEKLERTVDSINHASFQQKRVCNREFRSATWGLAGVEVPGHVTRDLHRC